MSSRLISGIFNAKEPNFSHRIADFERLSGRKSHDIRVMVEAMHHFKDLSERLDLDRQDTTPQELYHSLLVRSRHDSERLARRLGIENSHSPEEALKKCIEYLEKRLSWRKFWCVKHSVLKRQLKTNPPKKTMKILGFRSADSILKREPVVQTLILARMIEGPIWQKKYVDQAGAMTNSDFDDQKIEIKIISPSRLVSLKKAGVRLNHLIYSSEESSDIIAVPASNRFEGDVLFYFDTMINHINGVIRRSSFYRYKGLQPDFFQSLKSVREQGFKRSSSINWPIRWSVVVHSIQHHGNSKLAEKLDLNIPAHDLFGMATEREMQQFGIWEKGLVHSDKTGNIVSMHLSDVIVNVVNKNSFEDSYSQFGINRLYDELFSRYLLHDTVIENIFGEDISYE